MPKRLSPEERERRRKERVRFSFSDAAYQHYDPEREGYGGPEQWEDIARQLFGVAKLQTKSPNKWLELLDLAKMPTSLAELKKAFRAAMFKAHPDYGGSNEAARKTMEAFEYLKRKLI